MKKLIAVLLGCVAMPVWAAEVAFSALEAPLGEGVQLIFKSDKPIQSAPDLTTIEKHFIVSGTQQQMNSSYVNGRGSQSYELIYTLFPKTAGTVELTGLTLNGESLNPVSVKIVEQGTQSGAASAQILKLTASVPTPKIYQGESFVYTVRLTESVGVADGTFQAPEIAGARVQPLGRVKTGIQTVDGKQARVAEQAFLITPENAGTLTIPAAGFMGAAPDRSARPRRRASIMPDFFDNEMLFGGLQPMRQIYVQAKPVTVDVQAKPADWQGWWLPSTEVLVSEQYHLPDEIYAGTPFERKIVLSARGVDGNALPLITVKSSDNLNVYPSPEKRQTQLVNNDLLGTEEITFAFVPVTAGSITVPEIQIPWFDTRTKQRKVAVLPAKTIIVLAATGQETSAPFVPLKPEPEAPIETTVPAQQPVAQTIAVERVNPLMLGLLFGGGLFVGLLGALAGIWFWKRRAKRTLTSFQPIEKKRKKKKPLPDLYPFE